VPDARRDELVADDAVDHGLNVALRQPIDGESRHIRTRRRLPPNAVSCNEGLQHKDPDSCAQGSDTMTARTLVWQETTGALDFGEQLADCHVARDRDRLLSASKRGDVRLFLTECLVRQMEQVIRRPRAALDLPRARSPQRLVTVQIYHRGHLGSPQCR
jgi:hypothetical protein